VMALLDSRTKGLSMVRFFDPPQILPQNLQVFGEKNPTQTFDKPAYWGSTFR